jgi:hypothetical protein
MRGACGRMRVHATCETTARRSGGARERVEQDTSRRRSPRNQGRTSRLPYRTACHAVPAESSRRACCTTSGADAFIALRPPPCASPPCPASPPSPLLRSFPLPMARVYGV